MASAPRSSCGRSIDRRSVSLPPTYSALSTPRARRGSVHPSAEANRRTGCPLSLVTHRSVGPYPRPPRRARVGSGRGRGGGPDRGRAADPARCDARDPRWRPAWPGARLRRPDAWLPRDPRSEPGSPRPGHRRGCGPGGAGGADRLRARCRWDAHRGAVSPARRLARRQRAGATSPQQRPLDHRRCRDEPIRAARPGDLRVAAGVRTGARPDGDGELARVRGASAGAAVGAGGRSRRPARPRAIAPASRSPDSFGNSRVDHHPIIVPAMATTGRTASARTCCSAPLRPT